MKKYQTHGLILDHPMIVHSVLYRLTQFSFISLKPIFVFIYLSDDVRNPYIDELSEAETVSSEKFEEKVPMKTVCLMDKNTRKQIKSGTCDFEKINIVFFSNPNQIFDCFTLKEVEMLFARKSINLVASVTNKKVKIAPSIAMSKVTADTFSEFKVPFTYCEYYKEKVSVRGKKHLTLIMEYSISSENNSLAGYDEEAIDEIMDEFGDE